MRTGGKDNVGGGVRLRDLGLRDLLLTLKLEYSSGPTKSYFEESLQLLGEKIQRNYPSTSQVAGVTSFTTPVYLSLFLKCVKL